MWKVLKTNCEIGFNVQKPLLDLVKKLMPKKRKIMLAVDSLQYIKNCKVVLKSGLSYIIKMK